MAMVLVICQIISGLGYLCVFTYLLQVGWACASTCRQGRLREVVAGALSWLSCRKNKDDLDMKVRRLIEQERITYMHRYARPFSHVYGMAAVTMVAYTAPDLWGGGPLEVTTFGSLLDAVLSFSLCQFVLVFPRCVTSRMMDILYVALCTWWIIRMLILLQEPDYLPGMPVAILGRAILGIVVCNGRITCSCNVALWVCQSLSLYWHASRAPEGSILHNELPRFLIAEFYGTVVIILALIFFEQAVQVLSRQVLQIKASSKTEVTVLRLLSALCDAVVTLDPDLRISTRAPKLANLLLQGNPARALQGSSFVDLLADTDQERFCQFLSQAPEVVDYTCNEPEPAQALNVSLRDSIGTGVQVQLFHSHFHDDNGQVWHLIGVCEVGDTGGRQARAPAPNAAEGAENNWADQSSRSIDVGSSISVHGATDCDSETFIGDSVSVAGGAGHAAGAQGGADTVAPLRGGSAQGGADERILWKQLQQCECGVAFDALRFSIWQQQAAAPVIDASLLEMESLQQWVSEWSSCRAWLQDLINGALRPVRAASWPAAGGPPSSVNFHISFRGSCSLPPDVLTGGEPPRAGSGAGADAADAPLRAPAGNDGTGPPMRLAVSRVKLFRSRTRSPGPLRGGRRRTGRPHGLVQPTLVGAAAEALPAAASSSSARGAHGRPPATERAGPERGAAAAGGRMRL